MDDNNKSNIINFKKPFQFNIGRIIFAVLFVYLVIIVLSYAFKSHITAYEVQLGSLASNTTYTALAVRKEVIIRSRDSGYITYFAKECTKISPKSLVYALSNEAEPFDNYTNLNESYSNEELENAEKILDDFFYTFDNNLFYQTYNFYNSLNANLLNAALNGNGHELISENMSLYYGNSTGVIVYNIDGLESVTKDNFTDEEINPLNYKSTNANLKTEIKSGEAVYKVITDENWSLIIEVQSNVIRLLEGKTSVKIRFLEDDFVYNATFDTLIKNGKYYLILDLTNHMIRYADQRYIDIELLTEVASGYKIPTSCVTKEEFVKIPTQYVTVGGNSSDEGFLKQVKNKDGQLETVFFVADLYKEEDGYYYVLANNFDIGDKIVIPSTGDTYMINETIPLEGVYSVNKGYAVFKLVEVLYKNEDYCIIKTNTSYGVSNYDHIVLDGSEVSNGQMIN